MLTPLRGGGAFAHTVLASPSIPKKPTVRKAYSLASGGQTPSCLGGAVVPIGLGGEI